MLEGNVTSASQELVKAESNEDERIMQDERVERPGSVQVKVNDEGGCVTPAGLAREYAKSRSVEWVVHDTMSLVG